MSLPKLLSIQDVAEWLGVPVQTLYQWRHAGKGPVSIRVGRYVRYRPDDVEAWLAANDTNAEVGVA